MCFFTSRIFSFDADESSDRKPIEGKLSSFFISSESLRFRRYTNTELLYLHLRETSRQKVSHLMDEDDKSKYCKCQEYTEEESHEG